MGGQKVLVIEDQEDLAALYEHALAAQKKEKAVLEATKTDIGFGHQIRTYTFQPYQLIKDHRTDFEVGNVDAVMDGDIEGFLEAYLRSRKARK